MLDVLSSAYGGRYDVAEEGVRASGRQFEGVGAYSELLINGRGRRGVRKPMLSSRSIAMKISSRC